MSASPFPAFEEQALRDLVRQREELHRFHPEKLYLHWWPRCDVDVLLVTDGGLDFGLSNFGLRTFVTTLQPGTSAARFRITLAHRSVRSGDAMMEGDPAIAGRITNFRFDDPDHFSIDTYDQLWMFGISGDDAPSPTRRCGRSRSSWTPARASRHRRPRGLGQRNGR